MSNVNFHQYFSAELKEFHAILMYQQESYSKKLKECGSGSEFDETETLAKLKEATDIASEFFRGFSDLLAEGKMEKIKMNIQAVLSYIESSKNTYLKDYTKLFDEALERLAELSMIIEPTIQNSNGDIVFEKNIESPYALDVTYAINNFKKSSYILVGGGFVIILLINLLLMNLMGDGFFSNGIILLLNILYLFVLVFGFRFISTKLLSHKLTDESNESFVNNVGKLISKGQPKGVREVTFQNANYHGRIAEIKKKRDQENERPRSSFDKVVISTPKRSSESQRSTNTQRNTSSRSSTHSNYGSFYNSGYTSSSSHSGSDSSSSNCDGGSSGGGCD